MNNVTLIGRLTRDPDVRYTDANMAIARFSIAINRGKDKNGEDRGADFPNIVAFGKTAENCEKFLAKGRQVAIQGRLQTGSYEKDGRKVYTTDVVADRVEFIDWGDNAQRSAGSNNEIPEGFQMIDDDDIPF